MKYTINEPSKLITILEISGKIEEFLIHIEKLSKLFPDYSIEIENKITTVYPNTTWPVNPVQPYNLIYPNPTWKDPFIYFSTENTGENQ